MNIINKEMSIMNIIGFRTPLTVLSASVIAWLFSIATSAPVLAIYTLTLIMGMSAGAMLMLAYIQHINELHRNSLMETNNKLWQLIREDSESIRKLSDHITASRAHMDDETMRKIDEALLACYKNGEMWEDLHFSNMRVYIPYLYDKVRQLQKTSA